MILFFSLSFDAVSKKFHSLDQIQNLNLVIPINYRVFLQTKSGILYLGTKPW